jgi:hypothetical protein
MRQTGKEAVMGDAELIVRLTVVGHASRRWKGAKNAAQADQLNQRLSELRANNVRRFVEGIIRRELPTLQIEVPARGAGSHEPFPTASEDNAAVDRSVHVMVELTSKDSTLQSVHTPRKIYSPATYWTLKVVSMIGGTAVGARAVFLRVTIRNRVTDREIVLSGYLFGGSLRPPLPFKKQSPVTLDKLDPRTWGKPIGEEVTFKTSKPMDFEDWIGFGKDKGQSVRLMHAHAKTGVTKTEASVLQFLHIDHDPDALPFEFTGFKFSLGIPDLENTVLTGKLFLEGQSPGDFVDTSSTDLVRIQQVHPNYTGLLVSFPTGKADLSDLSSEERKRLADFVTNRARIIAAFASSAKVTNPRP